MKHVNFVHLNTHSQYSLLYGACTVEDLVKRACELRFPALALTDYGNMFGAIEFYQEAMKQGIKPILGMEAFVAPGSRFEKSAHGLKEASFHLTLLVKDETGYRNLMKLASMAYLEGFYYRPRVDKEILKRHHEGLIALSGGLRGEIPHYIQNFQREEALKVIRGYQEIFGADNFYLELFDHAIDSEKEVLQVLLELSKELKVPVAATNSSHYIYASDYEAHDALLCIGTGTTIEQENRPRFPTDQFYLKSVQEMTDLFKEFPEALENTVRIAERCNLELDFSKTHLPKFTPPKGVTPEDYMAGLCREGLKERFAGQPVAEEYEKRLDYELAMITRMKYVSYFLIVWDFIHFAKKSNIPVGPGRGSAAGSLVAYTLGITNIDPIRHGLIFERFLNPDRVSMPDIDIDFCYEKRDQVIDYVKKKYGHENVAQIITFGTMAAKGVIRDVGRVMGMEYGDVDRIAKLVPAELNMTLDLALKQEPRLKELVQSDARVAKLIEISKSLEGLTRHASTHAAGVVISDLPLPEHVPLFKAGEQVTTQYSMGILEKIGLLKMDFLGLKTLTVVERALRLIEERQKIRIDFDQVGLEDKKTYELLSRGEAFGVFQLESSGMRDILKKMKPKVFGEIVALLALYRPGPLGSGMVDDFIQRKTDPSKIKYDHAVLEPILKETYGVILYQEQVMHIVSALAGFSLAQADLLRRAIGKKIPEVMEKEKMSFIEGAKKNKVNERVADKIWNLIEYFSGYGFNKSHSAAYALVSYQTAYLKANYPVEFMTALLTSEKDNTDKIVRHVEEAKRMGIEVLAPCINNSFDEFTCLTLEHKQEGKIGTIRFGMSAIKNVGSTAIESVLAARKEGGLFKSFSDFIDRVDLRVCNRKVMESLCKSGAMDGLGLHRAQLMAMLDDSLERGARVQKDRVRGQLSLLDGMTGDEDFANNGIPRIAEWPEGQKLAYEKELLGFYISSHPLSNYTKLLKNYANANSMNLNEFNDQADASAGGIIQSVKEITTKKGQRMAFVTMEDLNGTYEVIVFSETFQKMQALIQKDALILVKGKVSKRDDAPKIIAGELMPLDEVRKRMTRVIAVDLLTTGLTTDILLKLKNVLTEHQGTIPLYLNFRKPNGENVVMSTDSHYQVAISDELFRRIEELAGEDAVKIKS